MAGGDAALFGKSLYEGAEIGDESVLADRETIELAAGARVLILEDTDFAVLARQYAVAKFLIKRRQHIAGTRKEAADGGETMSQFVGPRWLEL